MRNPIMRFRTNKNENFSDWSEIKLSDLGSFYRGLTYSGSNVVDDSSKFLVIRSSNIVKDWFVDCSSNLQFVDMVVPDSLKLQNEDLVICTANGSLDLVGKNAIYRGENEGNVTWGAFCSVFRGKAPLAKYIFRTNRYYRAIQKLKQGGNGALGNLNVNDLKGLTFFFPTDKNESEKIASFFSTLDEKIELSERKLKALEQLKKGLVQKIFDQKLRFKTKNGESFSAWEFRKIADVATVFAGGTPSTKIREYWEAGTIPWMSSGEVHNRRIFFVEKKISELGYKNSSAKMVKKGSVVIALAGQGKTRGTVAITATELCTNQSLAAIEPYQQVNSEFLYQYLKTQYQNLRSLSDGGSGRGGLNLKLISDFKIPVPDIQEQNHIGNFLAVFDKRIAIVERQIDTLKQLKKGFMQQMFV